VREFNQEGRRVDEKGEQDGKHNVIKDVGSPKKSRVQKTRSRRLNLG
jgi:hypothetical protein